MRRRGKKRYPGEISVVCRVERVSRAEKASEPRGCCAERGRRLTLNWVALLTVPATLSFSLSPPGENGNAPALEETEHVYRYMLARI